MEYVIAIVQGLKRGMDYRISVPIKLQLLPCGVGTYQFPNGFPSRKKGLRYRSVIIFTST